MQLAVGGTTAVIAQARASTDDAQALAQTTLSEIGNQLALTRLLLVIVALAIAIGQIVPYWVGRELRDAPVVVVADTEELGDLDELTIVTEPRRIRHVRSTSIQIEGEDRAERLAGDVVGMRGRRAQHEQRPQVVAAERAGVGRHRRRDPVGDLATLEHPHHLRSERIREPDRTVGVECATVGCHAGHGGPHPPIRERRVVGDVEGDVVARRTTRRRSGSIRRR